MNLLKQCPWALARVVRPVVRTRDRFKRTTFKLKVRNRFDICLRESGLRDDGSLRVR